MTASRSRRSSRRAAISNRPRDATRSPERTPGRPKESGSRQQTRHDQNSQTGDPRLDRDLTGPSAGVPTTEKPTRSATAMPPPQVQEP